MKVTSNLGAVRARLAKLPGALAAALTRAQQTPAWEPLAQATAERVLRGVARGDERHWVSAFVARIKVWFARGLHLRLSAPPATVELAFQPTLLGGLEFAGDADRAREWIEKWVRTPEAEGGKRRDGRDTGKSDQEIIDLISTIMLAPEGAGYVVQSGKNKGKLARNVLHPHIAEFVTAQMAEYRLPAATVDFWLRTVLAAWRELVRVQFPVQLRQELRKEWATL